MLFQACLNGGRSKAEAPGVPVTHQELAADAAAVRQVGAAELHVHPRNGAGAESLDPADVAACLGAIRAAVPGMPVGVGTGAWIAPGGRPRLDLIRRWTGTNLPDYASVNLNEVDAPETMEILLSLGIGIEAGIWTAQDAARLADLPFKHQCLRILLEMTSDDPAEATREYHAARAILSDADIMTPILLHGEGGSVWPMVALARADGHATRIGFEDTLTLPDGGPATSNAEIVAAALRFLEPGAPLPTRI